MDEFPPETLRSKFDSTPRDPVMRMLLYCYSKLMDGIPLKTIRSKLDSALTRNPWTKALKKNVDRLNGQILIFLVTPTLCFGVQFYLIVLFNRHHLVSQVWSFGQIIAVAVWLPSIFEYYHDVISKCYVTCTHSFDDWLSGIGSRSFKDWLNGLKGRLKPKYTSLLRAMRDIVHQTVIKKKIVPMGRSNHAASSDSDPEAVPLQSFSSAVDSHGSGQEDQQQEIVIDDSVRPA